MNIGEKSSSEGAIVNTIGLKIAKPKSTLWISRPTALSLIESRMPSGASSPASSSPLPFRSSPGSSLPLPWTSKP